MKRRLIEVRVSRIQVETIECDGVKQSRTTANYRFSPTGQALPLLLTCSYDGPAVRVPGELKSIGDHIRKRRLALKLPHRDVAEQIGVDITTVFKWEASSKTPEVRYMPAIIDFLGYNPVPEPPPAGERLVWQRVAQGEAARRMGVDPGTLARYERGERDPRGLPSDRRFGG